MNSTEKVVECSVFETEGEDIEIIDNEKLGGSRPLVKDKDKGTDVEKAERQKKPIPFEN